MKGRAWLLLEIWKLKGLGGWGNEQSLEVAILCKAENNEVRVVW